MTLGGFFFESSAIPGFKSRLECGSGDGAAEPGRILSTEPSPVPFPRSRARLPGEEHHLPISLPAFPASRHRRTPCPLFVGRVFFGNPRLRRKEPLRARHQDLPQLPGIAQIPFHACLSRMGCSNTRWSTNCSIRDLGIQISNVIPQRFIGKLFKPP